ncbi:hypothetical protein NL676_021146 [Syzygium grande]|nr:hypothetical protein NL676_021146 [Syzygium grande]
MSGGRIFEAPPPPPMIGQNLVAHEAARRGRVGVKNQWTAAPGFTPVPGASGPSDPVWGPRVGPRTDPTARASRINVRRLHPIAWREGEAVVGSVARLLPPSLPPPSIALLRPHGRQVQERRRRRRRRGGGRGRQPSRLQRRAPASLQIASPASRQWNVAIPLLSPLASSPTSPRLAADRSPPSPSSSAPPPPAAGAGGAKQRGGEEPAVAFKKWQHPAAPFCYEPAQRKASFIPV